MCIGIPMRVIEAQAHFAICESGATHKRVNTLFVGDVEPGQWLLVFLDTARDILTEEQARQLQDALLAVDAVINGNTDVDHLFADLVDRDPLPPHLRPGRSKADA
ncbi:MAG: HypC/HybG/HupF family hydrogenase formation chaperone [Gammaproteobacteria bacterium]|jgi:hydrogenase expression/formation protein HypC